MVDERYFQTSLVDLIEKNGVDDLLFLNNAFSAMTGYHANNLKKLMYQVYVPPGRSAGRGRKPHKAVKSKKIPNGREFRTMTKRKTEEE